MLTQMTEAIIMYLCDGNAYLFPKMQFPALIQT